MGYAAKASYNSVPRFEYSIIWQTTRCGYVDRLWSWHYHKMIMKLLDDCHMMTAIHMMLWQCGY